MGYFEEQLKKATAAGFVEPLVRFIETDREGYQSFNYALAYGHLLAVLDHADDLLQIAARTKGQSARQSLQDAADYTRRTRQELKEINLLWDRHLADRSVRTADTPIATRENPCGPLPT